MMGDKKIGMILAGVSLMAVVNAQAGGAPIPQAASSIKITNMGVRGSLIHYDAPMTIKKTYNKEIFEDFEPNISAFFDLGAKFGGLGANIKLDYDRRFFGALFKEDLGADEKFERNSSDLNHFNKEISVYSKVGDATVMVGQWRPNGIAGSDRNPSRNDWMWQDESYFISSAYSSMFRRGVRISMGVSGVDVGLDIAKNGSDFRAWNEVVGSENIYAVDVKGHVGQIGLNVGYQVNKGTKVATKELKCPHIVVKFGIHGVGLTAAYEKDNALKIMGVSAATKLPQGFGLRVAYEKEKTDYKSILKRSQVSFALGKKIQKYFKAEIGVIQYVSQYVEDPSQPIEQVMQNHTAIGLSLSANI